VDQTLLHAMARLSAFLVGSHQPRCIPVGRLVRQYGCGYALGREKPAGGSEG